MLKLFAFFFLATLYSVRSGGYAPLGFVDLGQESI